MNKAFPDNRNSLIANLALEFEFVPHDAWQIARDRLKQEDSMEFNDALPTQYRLTDTQNAIIENLMDQWQSDQNKIDRIHRKFESLRTIDSSSYPGVRQSPSDNSNRPPTNSTDPPVIHLDDATTDPGSIKTQSIPGQNVNSIATNIPADSTRISNHAATNIDEDKTGTNLDQAVDELAEHTRYEVINLLAEGGLGQVSIAKDRQLGRNVAFKQIKNQFADNSTSQRRFVFEAAITGQLEHPCIVPVYSLGRDGKNNPYYTMRLIEGQSLRDQIKQFHQLEHGGRLINVFKEKRLEFRQHLKRFVDLCEAIDFAHSRGVLHRDLKPANVMLGAYGETFVVDWGLARQMQDDESTVEHQHSSDEFVVDKTRQGTVVGTPAYMSPEQAGGEVRGLGPTSDVFSLGSILYFLLTGQKAFPQNESGSVIDAVRACRFEEPVEIRSNIPKALNAICKKAMAAKPVQRYSSARQLADDIERWLADEPVNAWNEPLLNRAGRWVRNHRTVVTTAVTLLFAAVIALLVLSANQRESNLKLTAANQKEKKATAQAERQFKLAQSRFELALDAIGQYHNGVTQDFILGQAEFKELRQQLLSAPGEFYRKLNDTLQQYSQPTTEQRVALIDSHMQLASLAGSINDHKAKLGECNVALEQCRDLLELKNDDFNLRMKEATITYELATALRDLGNYKKSERMFRDSMMILEAMHQSNPDNRETREHLTTVYTRLGLTLTSAGKPRQAIEQMEKGVAIDRLLLDDSKEDRSRRNLAVSLHLLSNTYSDLGDLDNAIKYAEECKSLHEDMTHAHLNEAQFIHEISGNLVNLAYMYQVKMRTDEALELYEQAEQAYRLLVEKAPNIARFNAGLASTLNNMGLLFDQNGEHERAQEAYEQSLQIKEQMVFDSPTDVDLAVSLGGGYVNYGGYFHRLQKYQSAIDWYTRGIESLNEVLEDSPTNAQARFFIINAHQNRFKAYRRMNDHMHAIEDMKYVLENAPELKGIEAIRNQYAQSHALSGNHRKASQLSVEMRASAATDADFYNLAFIQALAVTSANDDAELSATEKQECISSYVNRGIDDLRAMYKTEALTKQQFLDLLNNNPYLKPFHTDQAYQKFVAEFEE